MANSHQQQVDDNFAAFTRLLPGLLETHAGKFAVMHDGAVVEFCDSLADAVRHGRARFGAQEFSVQEVTSRTVNLGFHVYAVHQLSH
jgi:hypothetical protein